MTAVNFSALAPAVLSAGMDWTVKLWRSHSVFPRRAAADDSKPVLTFANPNGPVFDVQWCDCVLLRVGVCVISICMGRCVCVFVCA